MSKTSKASPRMLVSVAGALALSAALASPAQAGIGLDAAFGTGGTSLTSLSAAYSDRYYATAPAPGGGTYNVGYTSVTATDRAFVLTRTLASGALDPSFGSGGVAVENVSPAPFPAAPDAPGGDYPQAGPAGLGEIARGVVVQSDGKIVVSGQAETPAGSGKPDSRDIDIYVTRFNADGTLDVTFGTNGVTRVDLSDGITAFVPPVPPTTPSTTPPPTPTTSIRGDQAYGLSHRPDDKLLITGVKGSDSADFETRPDQDLAVVQLTANGVLDPGFGADGVAVARTPGINENPRQGVVEADGKFLTTGYGNAPGTPTRPWLYRFNPDGTADTTFGENGIATGPVGGAGGRAEVYGAVKQGDHYVLAGYGSRNETPADTDLVLYRFTGAGVWDESFGRDGLVTYAGKTPGGPERARNLTALPDGRIVAVGGAQVSSPPANVDGLIFVVKPDGTPDESVGEGGALTVDFGGPQDFFYGVTTIGYQVVAAGYLGGSPAAFDEAALVRLDLSPAAPATTPPATTPAVVPGPVPAPTTPAPNPVPISKPATTAGKVTVTCTRYGAKKDRIRCKVTQGNAAAGTVKVSLKRAGTKAVTGKAKAGKRSGKTTVTVKAARKQARYTVTITLPTPDGGTQTVKKTVTIK